MKAEIKTLNKRIADISVVIPAFNEEKLIANILKSLQNQTVLPNEIIVVDNNSTDKTSLIAKEYNTKLIHEKQKGVGFARQSGFMSAKASIIASTDADTLLPNNWLEKIENAYKNNNNLVGYGGIAHFYDTKGFSLFASKYLYYPYCVFEKIVSGGWNMSGFNMSVKKSAFVAINGFNTSYKIEEDVDLSKRLRGVGFVKLDRNLVVQVSARRYNNGFIKGIMSYFPSVFARVVLRKKAFNSFEDIR